MILFSGFGCKVSDPEVCLGEEACIMLSFSDSRERTHPRFQAVYNARKRKCESSTPECTAKSPRPGRQRTGGGS